MTYNIGIASGKLKNFSGSLILCYNGSRAMKWVLSILLLVVLFLAAAPVGMVFRACPWPFAAAWLLIPAGITALRYSRYGFRRISQKTAKRIHQTAFAATFVLSFLVFANFDFARDSIGHRYIEGYESFYYPDVDEFGRTWIASDVKTFYWMDRALLRAFEVLCLVLCIGLPILTSKMGKNLESYALRMEEDP